MDAQPLPTQLSSAVSSRHDRSHTYAACSVSAALSAVLLGAIYSPITYLTLLPIVGGVALASLKATQPRWKSCGLRPANQGSVHPYEHP